MTLHSLFPKIETETQFERVWALWPVKSKKALARARYESILRGCKTQTLDKDSGTYVSLDLAATEEEIYAGVKAYISAQIDSNFKLKDGGKYIPMLSSFLNAGRWEDHL